MTIARVAGQETNNQVSDVPLPLTFPSTPTEGNRMIAAIGSGAPVITNPTGWVTDIEVILVADSDAARICSRVAEAAEPTVHTWTFSVSDKHLGVMTEVNSSPTLTLHAAGTFPRTASQSSSPAGSLVTTQPNCYLFGFIYVKAVTSAEGVDSSYTMLTVPHGPFASGPAADRIVTDAAGIYNPILSWTGSGTVAGVHAAYAEAVSEAMRNPDYRTHPHPQVKIAELLSNQGGY